MLIMIKCLNYCLACRKRESVYLGFIDLYVVDVLTTVFAVLC